jgi:hypothetical protein
MTSDVAWLRSSGAWNSPLKTPMDWLGFWSNPSFVAIPTTASRRSKSWPPSTETAS